jgi:hypothetical protein
MIENEFVRRNDRLISKGVSKFGLAVYAVLFVAATSAFATAPQTETEIARQAAWSGSLTFGNRKQADRDGANHFLHQSAMRSARPKGKLFRGPSEFMRGRRKVPPLTLVILHQAPNIVYRTASPEELLSEAVRIWCQIHRTSLE